MVADQRNAGQSSVSAVSASSFYHTCIAPRGRDCHETFFLAWAFRLPIRTPGRARDLPKPAYQKTVTRSVIGELSANGRPLWYDTIS